MKVSAQVICVYIYLATIYCVTLEPLKLVIFSPSHEASQYGTRNIP